ncbi:DUF916 and DUF3324 domain-containing protein [Bacillus sp. AR18-7]|uniref:DUF916 and DUF3324 domain-containing protein n=1 Tax=Bacillus sp. AR18-7 TaxID=2217821 RepID=UPI0011CA0300|nr:DUF916 and DUF3324 domain-containing protein [Bacillus sp. AR18-7]TXR68230.1 DUF916 and DUF3324 domain-containing protein [Bacillus sp. AR18-7]
MRNNKKNLRANQILLLLMVLCWIAFPIKVGFAAESPQVPYEVQAILPENQQDFTATYYDLRVIPNQQQQLEVILRNHSDNDIEIDIERTTAKTNRNGLIDYGIPDTVLDPSLPYAFSTLVQGPSTIKLKPKEEQRVTFTLKMPETIFDGILLGGLRFQQKDVKNSIDEGPIQNRFAYNLAVKLQETDTLVTPELKLLKVQPELRNYRNVLAVTLQNERSQLVKGLNIEAKIYKKGQKNIYKQVKSTDLSMAPNSSFDYPIKWENTPFEPGIYELKMKAHAGEQEWSWNKTFTIEAEKANNLNQKAVELKQENNGVMYLLIGLLIVLILAFAYYVYRTKRRQRNV